MPTRLLILICSAAALIRIAGVVTLIVFRRDEQHGISPTVYEGLIGMAPDKMWFINQFTMPCFA